MSDEKDIDSLLDAAIITPEQATRERMKRRYGEGAYESMIGNRALQAEAVFQAAAQQANRAAQYMVGQSQCIDRAMQHRPAVTVDATYRERYDAERQRATKLADECGRLRQDRQDLMLENCQLRRDLDRAKRKSSLTGGDGK